MNKQNKLTFEQHWRELKHRLLFTLGVFLVTFLVAYFNSQYILKELLGLGIRVGFDLVYISPQEILLQQIRLSGSVAILVTLPVMFYNATVFIAPVFENTRMLAIKLIGFYIVSLGLFALGLVFSYRVLLPFTYHFLYDVGATSGVKALISTERYLNFLLTLVFGLGVVFELPLACVVLTLAGILDVNKMVRLRKFVVIGCFIMGAIITPPDIISQCLVAIPMIVLYQISIWFCRLFKGRRNKNV